jgi:hypothetical protein
MYALSCLCFPNAKVPLSYHKLLVRLHGENKQRLSFDEVIDVAKQCSMPTVPSVLSLDGEVRDALRTLHRLGQLLWWGDIESLNNTIVLDPQWLITAFTTIIRDPSLHSIPWLDTELDRLIAAGKERQAKLDSVGITTRTALVNARAAATSEKDIRDLEDSISVLHTADAVRLLRERCVLAESLFDTVWPVSDSDADITPLPEGGDAATASPTKPRFKLAEQKVRTPFCFQQQV